MDLKSIKSIIHGFEMHMEWSTKSIWIMDFLWIFNLNKSVRNKFFLWIFNLNPYGWIMDFKSIMDYVFFMGWIWV